MPAQYGCGLYLEPAQLKVRVYLVPAQYGCGLYLEPAQLNHRALQFTAALLAPACISTFLAASSARNCAVSTN